MGADRRPAHAVALVLLAGVSLVHARADDALAEKRLKEAYEHWKDETPDECLRLAESALAAEPERRILRAQILLFLGSVHHLKTGHIDLAIARYDDVINSLQNPDPPFRPVLADAMVRKGNLLYAERDDPKGALALYIAAQQIVPLATTADTASQLLYRLGRQGADGDAAKAQEQLSTAVTLAKEAVATCAAQFRDERRAAKMLARFRLQLVIALEGSGKKAEGQTEWQDVRIDLLDDGAAYQLAVLHGVRGEADEALESMRRFMAVRPTPATRNQLRKFIRTEPDLVPFLERDGWRALVTDEPEDAAAPPPAPAPR
jgi:tetratricopeptide (TPR) repeat protein